ncbi:MAG: hypothetical protein A3I75_01865 [Deltaproteobacteria bacterium RIFCSPLOWO2_02_FULL_50_16]|nr:MAG: hypothetical protein A2053_03715 [Deltaproteobacteria bacterium GWA2_50_8]OGQ25683.1 MAG: hypothetical protein A3B79_07030 [Deltaproteobacteria bacterium RIFCSPHIGHO2_02_FULL_50_15]OGQ56946.1 MAG: hypothetical protein A3I75_01865 [Deltaproteobacteria bacterium RIFCSPLOWO2_02_FULL_50_16]OGQ68024.1 MAG: hypothetical protein A3F89_05560 [Deltaproteobacteria bacterium RIFCSPLOWO2_12_FULL_50_11]
MSDFLLKLERITKVFSGGEASLDVLKGVDFTLGYGESVAILGASGVGKSTLLHIMGGLDRPSQGSVLYKDKDLQKMNANEVSYWRNHTLGFVFQFHHLLPELTVLENVALPLMIRGVSKKKAIEQSIPLLESLGLGHHFEAQPATLSGGEQQRTAVARALVTQPEILLADEPTGNLDRKTGDQLMDLIYQCRKLCPFALVIVTHNEAIAALCPRKMTLFDGQLCET